mmetsp:Transcript_26465/g.55735  ORF Transcript_26465/g.55735 Transcript_26465/m.55735 type:complete len:121 (-) Transcript_26465:164-526(-)
MAEPQQPDGAYPRVNATMINEGLFNNMIVSIIGRAVNFDGVNLLQLESGDGGRVNINLSDAEFHYVPGQIIEVIGHLDGKNIQFFISRQLGDNMDLGIYNDMIAKVQRNPKYKDLFDPFN